FQISTRIPGNYALVDLNLLPLVSASVTVTLAPATTAPDASVTVPRTVPRSVPCPKLDLVAVKHKTKNRTQLRFRFSLRKTRHSLIRIHQNKKANATKIDNKNNNRKQTKVFCGRILSEFDLV